MNNIYIFKETEKVIKEGKYQINNQTIELKLNPEQITKAIYLSEENIHRLIKSDNQDSHDSLSTHVYLENKDSYQMAIDMINSQSYLKLQRENKNPQVLVLNFANPYHPGGGVRYGSLAQEEDLCRKSTLIASLESNEARAFYDYNQQFDYLGTDAMLLSPYVEIIRNKENNLLIDTYKVAVLTSAACNIRQVPIGNQKLIQIMKQRIMGVMAVALKYHYQFVVLGAWGCGAFGLDAKIVAKLFDEVLKEMKADGFHLEVVGFAVKDNSVNQYNYTAFKQYFDHFNDNQKFLNIDETNQHDLNHLDAIQGCLIGGAIGDALGYPIEFYSNYKIKDIYGDEGLTKYQLSYNVLGHKKAIISDDTQMTLFTAIAIMVGDTNHQNQNKTKSILEYIDQAYKEWYYSQVTNYKDYLQDLKEHQFMSWLLNIPELFVQRAPGITCLSGIKNNKMGTMEQPLNDSCGCGGIMRVAPLALYYFDYHDIDATMFTGAKVAALTHGHSLGYMPAAALVYQLVRIINERENDDFDLEIIMNDSVDAVKRVFKDDKHLNKLVEEMQLAIALTKNKDEDLKNIERLGEGWVGDEALVISMYCALKYQNNFTQAIITAVNHQGDSDSTGAITGNLVGAIIGYQKIDHHWKKNLEIYDVILEVATDLSLRYHLNFNDYRWKDKYLR